jgi:diacylglycerol kinase family enzyme
MIYFNPNAGKNSKKHFDNVIDFISLTNLSFDVLETNGRGHCQNHANNLDTTKYIAAVIISGDGLMH